MTLTHCPDCGEQALASTAGLLTPQPTRVGTYRIDGARLLARDVARLIRTTNKAGHSPHTCPPPGAQTSLFDLQEA